MVWTKRGHPSLYTFIYILFFSIHFIFQLAFEIFYLVLVFFLQVVKKTFPLGEVECHSPLE